MSKEEDGTLFHICRFSVINFVFINIEQSCIRILIILNTISVVISILPFLVIPLFKSNV